MALSFTDALNEARRKALLTGMPLTDQETAGITNGWFNAQAGLANQNRANKLAQDQLAQNRWATQAQLDAAQKAATMQQVGNIANSGLSILGNDYLKSKAGESLIAQGYDKAAGYLGDAAGWAGEKVLGNVVPDLGASAAQMGSEAAGNLAAGAANAGAGLGADAGANGAAISAAPESFAMGGSASALTPALSSAAETGAGAGSLSGALSSATGTGSGVSLASTAPAAGFSAYLGPAGAGFAAPGLMNAIHKDSTENLGHNLSLGLIQDEGTANALGSAASGAAAGAAMGSIVPGVGTAIGAVIGGAAGLLKSVINTWICTATARHSRMEPQEEAIMLKLKNYASENHAGWWNSYYKNGTRLIDAIAEAEKDLPGFYENIRRVLIEPVCRIFEKDKEAAFQIYLFVTQTLFRAYMPELQFKPELKLKETK
jgi:hypothetical protein